MSKKRQARNSRKFKKAAASKRARMPKQRGGFVDEREMEMREPRRAPQQAVKPQSPPPVEAKQGVQVSAGKTPVADSMVFAGGTPNFDERTGQVISPTIMSDGAPAPGGIMSGGFVPPEMSGRVMPTRRPSPAEQQRNAEIARKQQEEMASIQEAIARGEVPIPELSELQGQQQRSNQVFTNRVMPSNAGEARRMQQTTRNTGAPSPDDYPEGAEDAGYIRDMEEFARTIDFGGYNPFNPGGRRDGGGSSIPGTGSGLPANQFAGHFARAGRQKDTHTQMFRRTGRQTNRQTNRW